MKTGTRIEVGVELETIVCANSECGICFAVDARWVGNRRRDHASFYCPNGHPQHFPSGTVEQKRIRELEAEKKRAEASAAAWREDWRLERDARQQVKRQLTATKGVLTKTRKRIAGGVCPCCSRHFVNVARHMAAKHPEYATEV